MMHEITRAMFLIVALLASKGVRSEDCLDTLVFVERSSEYGFSVSTAVARVGEVVPIDVSLAASRVRADRLSAVNVVICFDALALQPVAPVDWSDFSMEVGSFFYEFDLTEDVATSENWSRGRLLSLGGIRQKEFFGALESGGSRVVATVYFRVLGEVGTTTNLGTCSDFDLVRGPCEPSALVYGDHPAITVVSTENVSGAITIVPGPPVVVDIPELPPVAKIYPEAPSTEEAGAVFELVPRAPIEAGEPAPVDLYLTSAYESTGFTASITYPVGLVQVADVRWEGRRGSESERSEEGHLVLALLDNVRRLAAENERVRLATIDFELADGALPAGSIDLRLEEVMGGEGVEWGNHIRVRAERGDGAPAAAVSVEPLEVDHAELLPASRAARAGDVDGSGSVDISDAVGILRHLFGGAELACAPAADFDASGTADVTDAVAVLDWLFRGGERTTRPVVECER